jgi:hypothetical protein
MTRVSKKTYAYGQTTDTDVRLKQEHDALLQKWKNDPNLKIGNLTQPNQSEKSEYCVCGGHYSDDRNKRAHLETKKHKDFIEKHKNQEQPQEQTSEKSVTYNKNRRCHADGFIDSSGAIIVPPGDKCVYETCVKCGIEYPTTPLYFNTEYIDHSKTNYERVSGKEVISNSPFYGCRECSKKVTTERSKTDDECIRNLLKTYPLLTKEWFVSQPFVCSISNIPLCLKKNDSDIWTASIQNNKPGEEHTPENCCLVAKEFNVQQQGAIPDLLEAWKEAFQLTANEIMNPSNTEELVSKFKQWYIEAPKQTGVKVPSQITNPNDPIGKKITNPEYTKLRNMTYFKAAFGIMLDNVRRDDKKSKRNPNIEPCNLTVESMYQQLIKQNCKCYYTGIPFSLNRDTWNYFSCERLDNSKNHTVENCVFICRMLNGPAQINRKKVLTALLSQIHVPLSDECKLIIQSELNSY